MSETITLVLPGTPQPKGRPRFTGNGRTYTDAKTRAAEQSILAAWLTQVGPRPPHDGPVEVHVVFAFVAPASWPKWKRERASWALWDHTTKPDLDNLVKILDGLNGRAWLDDSQIVSLAAMKAYDSAASTTLTLQFHPAPTK